MARSKPLSFAQERLWFLHQLEPDNPAYNGPAALEISGKLDIIALELALNEIARRHHSLRTIFIEIDGRPIQAVVPAYQSPLPIVDLSGLAKGASAVKASSLADQEGRRQFALAKDPPLR